MVPESVREARLQIPTWSHGGEDMQMRFSDCVKLGFGFGMGLSAWMLIMIIILVQMLRAMVYPW